MKELRDLLPEKIDLFASKMKPYEGFIFLCGGPTDIRQFHPASIRDAIYRELAKNSEIEERIRLAEHYKDWAHDGIYGDLVLFERHLAELSSVIVLALESPGSLAELGLFSIIHEFQDKLLVFMETSHYQSDSFIKLGPINFLENTLNNKANCHRWLRQEGENFVLDQTAAADLQQEMAEAVLERIKKPTKERIFRREAWLDQALLLCDLISLHSALTLREIRDLFKAFDCDKTEAEIKQYLYLLEKVRLLTMEPRGEQRFYISIESRQFLQFNLKEGHFDLNRYRSDVLASYFEKDKKRFKAIQAVRQNAKK